MKSERVWKSNLGDFESSVSSALYRVCVSLSLDILLQDLR